MAEDLLEKIVSLCKRRGFVYPGSEIYGGFAGVYDYGPYGVLLRNNVADAWIRAMGSHDNINFIDSGIFTSPKVWEASGHVSGFNDPVVICLSCRSRLRADHLLESVGIAADEKMSERELNALFNAHRKNIKCPICGKKSFGKVVKKSLMATSNLGGFDEQDKNVYLRAETAQGIFINFKNFLDLGYSVPFGIAQIGKVFRNEISPRQFLFRKREFEQMEMQYFVHPRDADSAYDAWKKERMAYYETIGIAAEHLRWKKHEHLAFYARDAWDIEYSFPFGWGEIEGVHNRGDYDLKQHQEYSGVEFSVQDAETAQKYIPYVIETSAGLDRTIFALLVEAYDEDKLGGETRTVLRFLPRIAPIKAAVFPLVRNKPELVSKARDIFKALKKKFIFIAFDDNGNIGKRYRRQDEIGTPWCVTVDYETLENDTVTVRDRDSGEQERIAVSALAGYFDKKLNK